MRGVFVNGQCHVGSARADCTLSGAGQGSEVRKPLEAVRIPRQPTIELSISAVTGVKAI